MPARGVRALLELIRGERPSVLREVDRDSLAWWTDYFAKPQIAAELGWAAVVGAVFLTIILSRWACSARCRWPSSTPGLVTLAGAAALLAGSLYGLARPRDRWMKQKRFTAPMWMRLGWAPAAMALLPISALTPVSPWLTPVFAIASLWLVYWVAITGEPNRRGDHRYPWALRALFNFAYLSIFWAVSAAALPSDVWVQMSFPMLSGMIVFTWGAGTLYDAVSHEIGEPLRRAWAWSLTALVALAFVALIGIHQDKAFAAPAAALAAGAVFLHKTLDRELGPNGWRLRAIAMAGGWVIWLIMFVAYAGPHTPLRETEIQFGCWLLTGPAMVAGAVLLRPLLARRAKPSPKTA